MKNYLLRFSLYGMAVCLLWGGTPRAQGEVMLQFFNLTWQELSEKMPEIAETGYTSLWLPPPQKASGDLSVGYDLWDPFDIGGNPQRTGGRTRWGTEEEMLRMIETAHRFGIRVYFDNIMNHRAFNIPGFNEDTPIDLYPGMLPEDFHVQVTEEGFYRPWGNTENWGSTWEVQHRYLSGLIDIAHETGLDGWNRNFGPNEGDSHPGISFVRHPDNPEYYDYHPTEGHVGFGSPLITTDVIAENPEFYTEDVNSYQNRSVRWLVDYTKLDGLRLDAVKHVPGYFFGRQHGTEEEKNESTAGYLGQAQWQFNQTRGFSEANLRGSMWDTELPRVSMMMFGEHMGEPPGYSDYWDAGMRLLDARTHSTLNSLTWLDDLSMLQTSEYIEGFQMGKNLGVYYAKSHDDDVAFNEHLQYAINLTRAGLPGIYTDGNRQAPTLGDSGGAFPRHANTRPFGQFGDTRIPNLVHIHNAFSRGDQIPRWGDNQVLAYERRDKRENWDMTDGDGTVLFFMMSRNWDGGEYRDIPTSFPDGSILWQYAHGGGQFYHQVQDGTISVMLPPAGYFVFSWRSPEESDLWKWGGGKPIEIKSDGEPADAMSYVRWDGPDGDAQFNPFGLSNRGYPDGVEPEPFTYMHAVPRVTSATNLSFFAHVDGSAENVMFKLNGGVPLNDIQHHGGDERDHPPGWDTTDVYLGYEQADFHSRIGPEKFGAVDADRNKIGSAGAETYQFTVGDPGFTIFESETTNDWDGAYTAVFVYHDPQAATDPNPQTNQFSQFWPPPEEQENSDIYFWVKTGDQGDINRVYIYYTTDGESWPEGAGGRGIGQTRVAEVFWQFNADDGNDWWGEGILPGQPEGTVVRYKVGAVREQGYAEAAWDTPYPNSWDNLARKLSMMGTWKIENFNPSTVVYHPHNDYGVQRTGLVEGFNIIRARAFLQRDGADAGNGQRAAIYNTFYQPFYYDAEPPSGEVVFPEENDTVFDNRYGAVVRTDPTVRQVWYNIVDTDPNNDDKVTGANHGNGLNADDEVSWIPAQRVNPSINIDSEYPLEWRFNYVNIPSSGQATIRVKLGEYSSSTNPLVSDVDGRFTTLDRTINTQGPEYRMNVAWPQNDGDVVSVGYVMKVSLSRTLWTSEPDIINRTLITINGVPQDRDLYQPVWFGEGDHELGLPLPDLFNGDPNYEHVIAVIHTNAAGSGITLNAERRVRVTQGAGRPPVLIIDPPEFNLDGDRYRIVLPDVANPDPEQRQHNISVQTSNTAQSVSITFTNSTGFVTPIAAATNTLSGTVSVTTNSTTVTGTGTAFDEEVSAGSVLEIATRRVVVANVQSTNTLTLTSAWRGETASGLTAKRITGNPTAVGNSLFWQFLWTNLQAGTYTIVATGDFGPDGLISNQRTTPVLLRQVVERDDSGDSDNDGIPDADETTSRSLPDTNPETWENGDVHMWLVAGRTDPLRPITDGGGLPDGLQLGLVNPLNPAATDTSVDTNGDGWPNFISDRDPPIFNTTDNWEHPRYNFNASRTDQLGGSMTDPNRADTDGDGLPDHIEDLNRNGRVDVGLLDGSGVVTNILRNWFENRDMYLPMVYHTSRVDRDALPANARFLETDPNSADTIGDGMSDGAADTNANGRVDMLLMDQNGTTEPFDITAPANQQYLLGMDAASQAGLAAVGEPNIVSRAINYDKLFEDFGRPRYMEGVWQDTNKWPRVLFLELDPLVQDTNQDGLRDGWKVRYGLDPFDDGWYNLRTGQISPTNTQQGADGDLTGDGVVNSSHQSAGTDPRVDITIEVPEGSITIGPGPVIGQLNGVDIHEEFMDWTWDDLRALDYYHGGGINSKQGDVYRGWDGFDTSRDLVAFYTRDGGPSSLGGDDRFYFRVDMYDLQPFAEEEYVDVYVVIDTGDPNSGERVLPDQVDTLTDMRWQLVVAVYNSASGRVYVDMNPNQNTSTFTDDLFTHGGVVGRDDYFIGAYFNSELDAVEFAIDRQALLDVNYIGDPGVLNFQVFTTKPGTENSPPGPGDIGGRSDIRDSILNDYIAEDDHWAQAGLQGAGSVLRQWIRGDARPNRAKFSKIVHGNQAIQPGSVIQDLVNNDAGAGYYRVLDVHETFGMPLNMHITPTLASALQWASVDPTAGKDYRDGPALNARIADLAGEGTVALLASTFSDHMMPYFTPDFIADNVALASEFLEEIYGVEITANSVFWTPERLLDADVFNKIAGMGFRSTVIDQMEHLFHWYGRQAALGTRGYQLNRIDGVDNFVINNGANDFRFANHNEGLAMPLRRLFNRQARGNWDQVVILISNWEDFTSKDLADAYDRNVRWMANRPWIHGVTLESILREEVDLNGDGEGQAWYVHERPSPGAIKLSHNYFNYMTRGDFDNWYVGSGLEEGLAGKVFDGRPGVPVPNEYGMLYTGGIISQAWDRVQNVADDDVSRLARSVLHASVFQTAFHSGEVGNMQKYSNGTYIEPDNAEKDLAGFVLAAQAQTRKAAIYDRVNQWLSIADTLNSAQTAQEDIDLDGENEYLLYNERVFAVFEQLGGRMIAAWVRDPNTGAAYQTIGNLASWAGSATEWEGESNENAYRTSALKDWWADASGQSYANDLYSFSGTSGGWAITSSDNQITKTVTLGDDSAWFTVNYQVDPSRGTLYVRNGLSPDLYGLLLHGQQYLSGEQDDGTMVSLSHLHPQRTVSALVAYGGAHNAMFNDAAVDGNDLDTRRMRNQAQTHQVELAGNGSFSFAIGFEVGAEGEQYNEGVPYSWLNAYGYDPETVDVHEVLAANNVNTLHQAYIANLEPDDPNASFGVTGTLPGPNSIVVRFATRPEREYVVWYTDNGLMTPTWLQGPSDRIQGTGGIEEWEDDGTETDPHPTGVDHRFYKIEVLLPDTEP